MEKIISWAIIAFLVANVIVGAFIYNVLSNLQLVNVGASSGSTFTFTPQFLDGAFLNVLKDKDNDVFQTPSSTLSAAMLCENTVVDLQIGNVTTSTTRTLPTAPQMDSKCLNRDGAVLTVWLRNATSGPGTIDIAAGASSTLYYFRMGTSSGPGEAFSTTSISVGHTAKLEGIRITSSTSWILWYLTTYGK